MSAEEFYSLPFNGLSSIRVKKYFSIIEEKIKAIDYEEMTINGHPIGRITEVILCEINKRKTSKKLQQ